VLSPGPGTPRDFDCPARSRALRAPELPTFGVCLGLQGMVEHFGGALGVLDPDARQGLARPRARRALFAGCRRVHRRPLSLAVRVRDRCPPSCRDRESEDGVVMAIEHATLPSRGAVPPRVDHVARRRDRDPPARNVARRCAAPAATRIARLRCPGAHTRVKGRTEPSPVLVSAPPLVQATAGAATGRP
jgi:hypothetical protein